MFNIITSQNISQIVFQYFTLISDPNINLYTSPALAPNIIQVKTQTKEFSVLYINKIQSFSEQLLQAYDYIFIECISPKDLQNIIQLGHGHTAGIFQCNAIDEVFLFITNFIYQCDCSDNSQIYEKFVDQIHKMKEFFIEATISELKDFLNSP